MSFYGLFPAIFLVVVGALAAWHFASQGQKLDEARSQRLEAAAGLKAEADALARLREATDEANVAKEMRNRSAEAEQILRDMEASQAKFHEAIKPFTFMETPKSVYDELSLVHPGRRMVINPTMISPMSSIATVAGGMNYKADIPSPSAEMLGLLRGTKFYGGSILPDESDD